MGRVACLAVAACLAAAMAAAAVERVNENAEERLVGRPGELTYKPLRAYMPLGRRDPFVAYPFRRTDMGYTGIRLEQLELSGFFSSGSRRCALFRTLSGESNLLLKGGKLYTGRKEQVESVSGKILNSKQVVLAQGEQRLTYTLSYRKR